MYILAYESGPAPDCTNLPYIIEVSTCDELITQIRNSVFGEFFKLLCEDPPESDNVLDVMHVLAEEQTIDTDIRSAMCLWIERLARISKSTPWEELDACIQTFNEIFDDGNATGWSFGAKIIKNDSELADFISGDLGQFSDVREEAKAILQSHQ